MPVNPPYPAGAEALLYDPNVPTDEPPQGWDALDDEAIEKWREAYRPKLSEEAQQIREHIARTFSTPDGRATLAYLIKTFMDPMTFDWTLPADQASNYGFWREGQRDLVRKLRDVRQQVTEGN